MKKRPSKVKARKAKPQTKEQRESRVVSLDSLRPDLPPPARLPGPSPHPGEAKIAALLEHVEEVSLQNKKLLQELDELGGEVKELRATLVKLLLLLKSRGT